MLLSFSLFAQQRDSVETRVSHFSGSVLATNNGISLIPTFSLGRPALVFDFSGHSRRLSFDPQLRFAMEGIRPWSFILWVRYKLIQKDKFRLGIGAHPSYVFKSFEYNEKGGVKKTTLTDRYWAGEIAPTYGLSSKVSLGLYYLYAHGLEQAPTSNTHFIAINSTFSKLKIYRDIFLKYSPQLYYLKLDEADGVYFSSTLTLSKQEFPLSISSITTKVIESNIISKDFVWNISLIYNF